MAAAVAGAAAMVSGGWQQARNQAISAVVQNPAAVPLSIQTSNLYDGAAGQLRQQIGALNAQLDQEDSRLLDAVRKQFATRDETVAALQQLEADIQAGKRAGLDAIAARNALQNQVLTQQQMAAQMADAAAKVKAASDQHRVGLKVGDINLDRVENEAEGVREFGKSRSLPTPSGPNQATSAGVAENALRATKPEQRKQLAGLYIQQSLAGSPGALTEAQITDLWKKGLIPHDLMAMYIQALQQRRATPPPTSAPAPSSSDTSANPFDPVARTTRTNAGSTLSNPGPYQTIYDENAPGGPPGR